MNLDFLGGTRTVTGSKYLLTTGESRVLVDCGLFQGHKPLRLRNREPFPVPPGTLSGVVLTHAHLDHSGYIPLLVANGYEGRILCTEATYELCRILLPDSGRLLEEEAEYANRHGYSKHSPALPLYTEEHAQRSLRQFEPIAFGREFDAGPGVRARLTPAGHILGAACVSLRAEGQTIVFSGDLGRPEDPVMRPPAPLESADVLVVESTYGDRRHDAADPQLALAEIINETVARGGKVIIPSFAVGRAQALLHCIATARATNLISAQIPVYLNSPMAADVTALYRRFHALHRLDDAAARELGRVARIVNSPEESKSLNEQSFPLVVISASGMATGGRVLHHLAAWAGDPRNTILFTGYQAGGTRGASILAGATEVKIHGRMVPVRAQVALLDGLSAHADGDEIIQWLRNFKEAPRRTFVTHGEPAAADALRRRIREELRWHAEVPDYLQSVELD